MKREASAFFNRSRRIVQHLIRFAVCLAVQTEVRAQQQPAVVLAEVSRETLPWSRRSFDRSDGLPLSPILTAARDPSGSIWLGTEGEGLFSWNGESLRPIPIFAQRFVQRLSIEGDTALLLSTDAGETRYRPYPPIERTVFEAPGFPFTSVSSRKGVHWLAADGWGIGRVDARGKTTLLRAVNGLFTGLIELEADQLIFSNSQGLWRLGDTLRPSLYQGAVGALSTADGRSYAYSTPDQLRIQTANTLMSFDVAGISRIETDGQWYYVLSSDSLFRVRADGQVAEGVAGGNFDWVRGFTASQKELILSGLGRVDILRSRPAELLFWPHSMDIKGLEADDSGLWLHRVDGWGRYNPKTKALEEHSFGGIGLVFRSFISGQRTWVASESGVYSRTPTGLQPILPDGGPDFSFDLAIDDQGVWVACSEGLYRLESGNSLRIEAPGLSEIEIDPNGSLYGISFEQDLIYRSKGKVQRASSSEAGERWVGLVRDASGAVWGCAASGVAHRYDQGRDRITLKRTELNAQQGRLLSTASGKGGKVALLFEYALLIGRLNSQGGFQAQRAFLPGLDYEINSAENVRLGLSSDRLWMLSDGRVQELEFESDRPIPPPVLSSFETAVGLGKALEGTGFAFDLHPFELPYHSSFLRVGLGDGPSAEPGRWSYRFELESLSRKKRIGSTGHEALFPTLEPGSYALRMWRVETGTGLESAPLEFNFKVVPPLWQRWWFIGLVSLVLGVAAVWLLRSRIEKVRESARIERELVTLESTALRLQMNPHFIFNALDSISAFIFRNDPAQATRYLSSFARLMRATLDSSHESFIPLSTELQVLRSYLELERLRTGEILDFSIECPEEWVDRLQVPPMVIQPFVENAVKHGLKPRKGQGKVSVDFSVFDEVLEVSVDDDGVGRAAARALNERLGIQKSSKGMGITERRLELLRKAYGIEVRIEVEDKIAPDGQPAGTRVRIVLPKVEFDA